MKKKQEEGTKKARRRKLSLSDLMNKFNSGTKKKANHCTQGREEGETGTDPKPRPPANTAINAQSLKQTQRRRQGKILKKEGQPKKRRRKKELSLSANEERQRTDLRPLKITPFLCLAF